MALFLVQEIPNLTPNESFVRCQEGAILIDLRKEFMRAWKQFKVPRVYYSHPDHVLQFITDHPKENEFILAETSSSEIANKIIADLIQLGYTKVYNLAGGFLEWERDGLPIKEDPFRRLSGSCMCQLKPRKRN